MRLDQQIRLEIETKRYEIFCFMLFMNVLYGRNVLSYEENASNHLLYVLNKVTISI